MMCMCACPTTRRASFCSLVGLFCLTLGLFCLIIGLFVCVPDYQEGHALTHVSVSPTLALKHTRTYTY